MTTMSIDQTTADQISMINPGPLYRSAIEEVAESVCPVIAENERYQKARVFERLLIPDRVISEDDGIYTSGGAYSFLNLIVYLIEKYYGRETAIWCSKMAEIDYDRDNQNHFIIFNAQKDHNDELIKDVQNKSKFVISFCRSVLAC